MTDSPIGFPPQVRQATLASLLVDLRARADTARTEAVTGRLADTAAGRNGGVAEVLDVEKRLADLETYRDSIALARSRAETTQASLTSINDGALELAGQAEIALQSRATVALEPMSDEARDLLGGIVSALNVTLAGRALFAGDDSDGAAVTDAPTLIANAAAALGGATSVGDAQAALDDYFADTTAAPVYLGGTGDAPSAEIAPGERVDNNLRADRPEIRAILRDVTTLAIAFDPDIASPLSDTARQQLAADATLSLRSELARLNITRGDLGSAEARIEEVSIRMTAEETRLTAQYNALTGRDTLEAAVEMRAVEGQLETLFLTTARLSQLSLANFLR